VARDVIDAVLGRDAAERLPSGTADRRLVGASDRPALDRIVAEIGSIPAVAAVHPDAAARLVARHGTEAPAVVGLGGELDLLRPLVPGRPFLEAEVAWAVRHEMALSVDDVLSRRFRLSPELRDRGAVAAPRVAEIMARELGWSETRRDLETDAYLATASREYGIPPSAAEQEAVLEPALAAPPVQGPIAG